MFSAAVTSPESVGACVCAAVAAVAVCVTSAVPVSVSTRYLPISTRYLHNIYTVDIQYEQWFHLSLVGTRTCVDKTRNVCQLGGWLLSCRYSPHFTRDRGVSREGGRQLFQLIRPAI